MGWTGRRSKEVELFKGYQSAKKQDVPYERVSLSLGGI